METGIIELPCEKSVVIISGLRYQIQRQFRGGIPCFCLIHQSRRSVFDLVVRYVYIYIGVPSRISHKIVERINYPLRK